MLSADSSGESQEQLLDLKEGQEGEWKAALLDGATPAACVAAAQAGHGDLLDRLLEQLPDAAPGTDGPLHLACFKGLAGAVDALAGRAGTAGALNAPGELGNTPLHLAAMSGSLQACKVVLCHGGEPRVKNAYGNTPASLAATAACRQLLSSIADGGKQAVDGLRADMAAAAAAALLQAEQLRDQQLREQDQQRQQEAEEAARLAAEAAQTAQTAQEEEERRTAQEQADAAAAAEQERIAAEAAALVAAKRAKQGGTSSSTVPRRSTKPAAGPAARTPAGTRATQPSSGPRGAASGGQRSSGGKPPTPQPGSSAAASRKLTAPSAGRAPASSSTPGSKAASRPPTRGTARPPQCEAYREVELLQHATYCLRRHAFVPAVVSEVCEHDNRLRKRVRSPATRTGRGAASPSQAAQRYNDLPATVV